MKILFDVRWDYEARKAGSERYTRILSDELIAKGHEVRYLVGQDCIGLVGESYKAGKADVFAQPFPNTTGPMQMLDGHYEWADIVVTHLDKTRQAVAASRRHDKPLVVVQHNGAQIPHYNLKTHECELYVFNAEWERKRINQGQGGFNHPNDLVVIPPLDMPIGVPTTPRNKILHVNCNKPKGFLDARHYAKETPELEWTFVMGSYFHQYVPPGQGPRLQKLYGVPTREISYHPNMGFREPTSDILDILYETAVFVSPSGVDSWGMMPMECMALGIPCVLHPCPAFLECAGDAALYVERQKAEVMARTLRRLMGDPQFYAEQQQKALNRAEMLKQKGREQRLELYERMQKLVLG